MLRLLTNASCVTLLSTLYPSLSSAFPFPHRSGLAVRINVTQGLFQGESDVGRAVVLFAPAGVDPLEDYDVTSSPDYIFGKNVYHFSADDTVFLSGGSGDNVRTEVYGWPNVSMDSVPAGDYSVQAFLYRYETVTRSDGSTVSVKFPCGDGAPQIDGEGALSTEVVNVTVTGHAQTIGLTFNNVTAVEDFTGSEIGGCSQGNYEDTELFKHVKIRSTKLSEFWKRDMYVGANILLPYGYDAADTATRYPVIYSQGHWPGEQGMFHYPDNANFTKAWNSGISPYTNSTAPKLILVTFRHETPFYDDSYAANTANIGPYGDAINDELIPHIDEMFNTIAEPYARIQEGGSTGGWESAANLIFRPDLFGFCFSSYPDSLDFHRHQDIHLYDETSAYVHADGTAVPSIRELENGTEVLLATTAQENHWELTFGTSSRSFLQWDIWQTVYGAQGYNGYPLEAWNKVTGEIYPEAVEYWKDMDLSNWITSNWDNELNLGEVLKGRVFIYVGTADNYFLNEGVLAFQANVDSKGGPGWANVTVIEGAQHGGNYQRRETWEYLDFLSTWIEDHSPKGKTPLSENVTVASARGNKWEDVQAKKGRQAAIARQADPTASVQADGRTVQGTVGRWDPGMVLECQWTVNGWPAGRPSTHKQGDVLTFTARKWQKVRLEVTGRKSGWAPETRKSNEVSV